MLMPLRSCYFVTDKTLGAKRISFRKLLFPCHHHDIFLDKIDDVSS